MVIGLMSARLCKAVARTKLMGHAAPSTIFGPCVFGTIRLGYWSSSTISDAAKKSKHDHNIVVPAQQRD